MFIVWFLDNDTKQKIIKEELKANIKDYHLKRKERIKNVPALAAIDSEKQAKLVKDWNERELGAEQKIWRDKTKTA